MDLVPARQCHPVMLLSLLWLCRLSSGTQGMSYPSLPTPTHPM